MSSSPTRSMSRSCTSATAWLYTQGAISSRKKWSKAAADDGWLALLHGELLIRV